MWHSQTPASGIATPFAPSHRVRMYPYTLTLGSKEQICIKLVGRYWITLWRLWITWSATQAHEDCVTGTLHTMPSRGTGWSPLDGIWCGRDWAATRWKQSVAPLSCKTCPYWEDIGWEDVTEPEVALIFAAGLLKLLFVMEWLDEIGVNVTGEGTNDVGNGCTGGLPSVSSVVLTIYYEWSVSEIDMMTSYTPI